jgi:hypothetical protein
MFRRISQSLVVLISGLFLTSLLQATTATLTPTSLSFGAQVENTTSAAKPVTLKNTGSTTLTINSIGVSGAFAQTNNCGATLAAGHTCTINVTFTPTTTGPFSGTLTVTDNATNSPQTTSLSGTGILPVTLTPASLSFGNQAIDTTSASQQLTLKNNQSVTLTISNVRITNGFAETNTCGRSLGAGSSCTINVTFTPTATGSYSGPLVITDNAPNSPQSAALSGTGVVDVGLSPGSLAFGNQVVNTSSTAQVITVTNNEPTSITVSSITTPTGFSQTNNCTTLAGGGTCMINVTFSPTAVTTYSGNLTITDNAASGSTQTVPLSGTGINTPVPASFFAMDINQNSTINPPNNPNDPWPGTAGTGASGVSFGTYRTLGSGIKWADLYDCTNGAYYFDEDATNNILHKWATLANPKQKMMFTAYYTPNCLLPSQYQNDTSCAFSSQPGGCDLPGDVLTSTSCPGFGTILDCTWVTFISHLTTYMNTNFSGQLGYIEVWNEPNVPSECNGNPGNCTQASLAQMVEDANTTAKGIISGVQIISPAVTAVKPSSGDCTGTAATIASYLNGLLSQTPAIATYADLIGFHGYVEIPTLQTAGSGKPDPAVGASCINDLINAPTNGTTSGVRTVVSQYTTKNIIDTEGSWGANCKTMNCTYLPDSWINGLTQTSSTQQVAAEQAAFAGQYYLIQASNTLCPTGDSTCNPMAGLSWYGWDFDNQGTDPGSTGQFWDQWTAPSGALSPAGTAYTILYSWLEGASPNGVCTSTSSATGVWTCYFSGSGTSASLAVWDNSKSCIGTGSSPCTFSSYSFPANTYTEWRDLYGNAPTQLSGATTVNIGLVPILLDNGTVPGAHTAGAKTASNKVLHGKAH